jgi:hypothetical protein
LSEKKSVFIESLSFDSFLHGCEEIGTLLLWGLLYSSLLILVSFACLQFGDPSEFSDFAFDEDSLIASVRGYFLNLSHRIAVFPSVFALILFFEYLRSHIGEKQPPDDTSELSNPSFARLSVTTPSYGVVFCFFQLLLCRGEQATTVSV